MKKFRHRWIENRLKKLFKYFPAVAVTGARQVGKTTLISQLFPQIRDQIVFDPILDIRQARHDPELFVRNLDFPVFLDEIQYAQEVIPSLKRRIDADRQNSLVLISGSQQWTVMKTLSESLSGRVAFCDLRGFGCHEGGKHHKSSLWAVHWLQHHHTRPKYKSDSVSKSPKSFDKIWRGSFPEVQKIPTELVPDFMLSYQRTYLERDARLLADIKDWSDFARFMRLAAALTSQEVNYSELGREIGINPQTAKKWLSILVGTFQWQEVPAFKGSIIKRISERPKGYFQDTGLVCHLQSIGSSQALAGHPLWGAIFETAVVMEITKQLQSAGVSHQLYHWRAHSGAEVDLIIEHNGILFPIEIKGKSNPTRSDVQGLNLFRQSFPHLTIAPGLVVSLCESSYALSDHEFAVPWDGLINVSA